MVVVAVDFVDIVVAVVCFAGVVGRNWTGELGAVAAPLAPFDFQETFSEKVAIRDFPFDSMLRLEGLLALVEKKKKTSPHE